MPPATDLARGANAFAFELWAKLPAGNVAVSPASIAIPLTIAWGGAKAETAAQMAKVLHLEGQPDILLSRWGALAKSLQDPARGLKLKIANRLYGEKSYEIDTIYFTIARKAFDAWIEPVDFVGNADAVRGKINAWVAEQTEQRIKDLLPARSVDASTRLVIVNAIYFLADWANPFDSSLTRPREFFVDGKTKAAVPTMVQMDHFGHAAADGATLVELPYQGGSASMYLIVPDARDGLPALEKKLPETLRTLQTKLADKTVTLSLPKFTLDPAAPIQLAQVLAELGMSDAFSSERADFTSIAKPKDPTQKLFLSSVLHKAFVKVDEKGTEAAAATAVAVAAGGPPPKALEVTIDRPFLFAIVDKATGLIVFMGRVVDPR